MRNFFYLILFCIVFTACYYGALNAPHPLVLGLVAVAALVIFMVVIGRRNKKKAEDRHMQELFRLYMRDKIANDNRRK